MLNHYSEKNPQYFDKDIGPNVARCVCGKADCTDVEECLLDTIDHAKALGYRAFSGDGAIEIGNDSELTAKITTNIDVTLVEMSENGRRARTFYVPLCEGGCGHYAHQCECVGEEVNFSGVVVHYIPESLKAEDDELRDAPGDWNTAMSGSGSKIMRDVNRLCRIKDREQHQKRVLFYKCFVNDHATYLEYGCIFHVEGLLDEIHIGHSNADGCNRNWKYQSGRKHKQWAKNWTGLIRQNHKFGEWACLVNEAVIRQIEENRFDQAETEWALIEREEMLSDGDLDAIDVEIHEIKEFVAEIKAQITCLERTFDNALRMDGVDFLPEVPHVDAISESEEVEDDSVARLDFDYVDSFQIAVEDPNPELTEQHVARVCKKEIPISSQQRFASEPIVYYVN